MIKALHGVHCITEKNNNTNAERYIKPLNVTISEYEIIMWCNYWHTVTFVTVKLNYNCKIKMKNFTVRNNIDYRLTPTEQLSIFRYFLMIWAEDIECAP